MWTEKRTYTEEVEPNMGLNGRKSANKKRETEDKNEVYRYGERKQSKRVYVCTCVLLQCVTAV